VRNNARHVLVQVFLFVVVHPFLYKQFIMIPFVARPPVNERATAAYRSFTASDNGNALLCSASIRVTLNRLFEQKTHSECIRNHHDNQRNKEGQNRSVHNEAVIFQ